MFQLKVEKPSDVFVSGPTADLTVNPGHNHMENRYTGTKVLLREMSRKLIYHMGKGLFGRS